MSSARNLQTCYVIYVLLVCGSGQSALFTVDPATKLLQTTPHFEGYFEPPPPSGEAGTGQPPGERLGSATAVTHPVAATSYVLASSSAPAIQGPSPQSSDSRGRLGLPPAFSASAATQLLSETPPSPHVTTYQISNGRTRSSSREASSGYRALSISPVPSTGPLRAAEQVDTRPAVKTVSNPSLHPPTSSRNDSHALEPRHMMADQHGNSAKDGRGAVVQVPLSSTEAAALLAPAPAPEAEPAEAPAVVAAAAYAAEATTNYTARTSVAASIQIQGPGTTPFTINNQNLLVNAYSSVMSTVTRADFQVRYFTSDNARIPDFNSNRRLRRLLSTEAWRPRSRRLVDLLTHPQAVDTNSVYATLQINAGSNARTQAVMTDFRATMAVTPPYGVIPVQEALQAYGQPNWSLALLSMTSIDPSQPLAVELICNSKFGAFCLDGSGLSQGEVKAIIACGCIFVVLVVSGACVVYDIRRRSGRMGELEMGPDTPRTPMQKAVDSLTHYLRHTLTAVRTPQHRAERSMEQNLPTTGGIDQGTPVTATVEIASSKQTDTRNGHQTTFSNDALSPPHMIRPTSYDLRNASPTESDKAEIAGAKDEPSSATQDRDTSTDS